MNIAVLENKGLLKNDGACQKDIDTSLVGY